MDALMHSMSSEASERLMVDVDGGKVYPFGRRLENRYLGWTKKIFYVDLQFTYLRTLRFKVMQINYEIL